MPNSAEVLEALLDHWEEQREQGRDPSPQELCRDCPELTHALEERLCALRATEWMLQRDEVQDDDFSLLPHELASSLRSGEVHLPEPQITVGELVESLAGLRLASPGDLAAALRRSPGAEGDAAALARLLVARGVLTPYQASVLLSQSEEPLTLDRYLILDRIDAGGMGRVYKARHRAMDRLVALKVLPPSAVDSEEKVRRFQREVKAAARLIHPNIVTAYDAYEAGDVHFLVMEYIEGHDLQKVVRLSGPLPIAAAVEYLVQAACGLAHAHALGVIHRDIKPSNLIRVERHDAAAAPSASAIVISNAQGITHAVQPTIKVLDMGLARLETRAEDSHTAAQQLTQAGMAMGTVAYMAPEQALDTAEADARADIYSLGCTLHFLLTGRPPFRGSTALKILLAHRDQPAPPLRNSRPDAPAELEAVYARMVAKRPEDRFQTMAEVIAALQAVPLPADLEAPPTRAASSPPPSAVETNREVDSTALVPTPAEEPGPANPPRSRRKRFLALAAAAALLAALGLSLRGVLVKIVTPEGTLIVNVDRPDAHVEVDGQKVHVQYSDDGKTLTIAVDPGRRRLEVTTPDGLAWRPEGGAVTVAAGGRTIVEARLEHAPPDAAALDRRAAQWVIERGGVVRVNGTENEIARNADLPKEPFKLTGIKFARDAAQRVAPAMLVHLGDLDRLEFLQLSEAPWDDDIMPWIGRRRALKTLYLTGTEVTDAGLQHLEQLTELTGLSLYGTNITDAGLAHLEGLKHLQHLNIGKTSVTAAGLPTLRALSNLEHLDVMDNRLSDAALAEIGALKSICRLEIRNSPISDAGLKHLHAVKSLHTLDAAETRVTAAGVMGLLDTLPQRRVLWDDAPRWLLSWIERVRTQSAPEQVEEVEAKLKALNPELPIDVKFELGDDGAITACGIRGGRVKLWPLLALPNLKHLRCPELRPAEDAALLRQLGALETINDAPAEEFWKSAQEEGKLAVPPR